MIFFVENNIFVKNNMKIAASIAINFIEAVSIDYQNKSLNRHVLYQVECKDYVCKYPAHPLIMF